MEHNLSFNTATTILNSIISEIQKVIIGKRNIAEMLMISLAAGGHILIEDMPGVGKTTIALALSKATNLEYKRIQFTPDTMPSDITGFNMYNRETNKFEYIEGVAICNLLLADEINRTVPKTQSSLLEVMEEGIVTVDGIAHTVPKPFMVIATQNPIGFIGTHTLPEAQLDRFLMKISMGYPSIEEEIQIITNRQLENPMDKIKSVAIKSDIEQIQMLCKDIFLDESIKKYIVNIVSQTRNHKFIKFGASPRASISLMKASQASALLNGRDYVIPEDISKIVTSILSHRIILSSEVRLEKISADELVSQIVLSTNIPYYNKKGRI